MWLNWMWACWWWCWLRAKGGVAMNCMKSPGRKSGVWRVVLPLLLLELLFWVGTVLPIVCVWCVVDIYVFKEVGGVRRIGGLVELWCRGVMMILSNESWWVGDLDNEWLVFLLCCCLFVRGNMPETSNNDTGFLLSQVPFQGRIWSILKRGRFGQQWFLGETLGRFADNLFTAQGFSENTWRLCKIFKSKVAREQQRRTKQEHTGRVETIEG